MITPTAEALRDEILQGPLAPTCAPLLQLFEHPGPRPVDPGAPPEGEAPMVAWNATRETLRVWDVKASRAGHVTPDAAIDLCRVLAPRFEALGWQVQPGDLQGMRL